MKTVTNFFDELAPRLDTARVLDKELDRDLARRFNVLDYLKTDELGLSRIIADLFDPCATHGQGVLFLRTFLANLNGLIETPYLAELDRSQGVSVVREMVISNRRKIDLVVQIPCTDGPHCLAIENKPYDHDRENQIKDYLEHLKKEYGDRFLLIYLSPTGEGPAEVSVSVKLLRKKWKSRFAIMPYYKGHEEVPDELHELRLSRSLADWLGECRKNCDVDRLRWFLRDAETFCQRTFGGQTMTTDSDTKTVEQYVLSDPDKLKVAGVVYESWPSVKEIVCNNFLERLCFTINQERKENPILKEFAGGMEVNYNYEGEQKYNNWLCMYRNCWVQYKQADRYVSDGHTAILLGNDKRGPNGWCIGVWSPIPEDKMEPEEKKRRRRLIDELKVQLPSNEDPASYWPWWKWVEKDKKNWDSLVPELHKEWKENGGEITSYFVNTFIQIAEKAVAIIDEIESR